MTFTSASFEVDQYDLAATLASGQAFRWREHDGSWEGVIGRRWVRLVQRQQTILVETVEPVSHWEWLVDYLQLRVRFSEVLATFPSDEPMQAAVAACPGLRLLRQPPWECLASFICSSTKQIVQIQQIVDGLCRCFGEEVPTLQGSGPVYAFPTVNQIASTSEAELRKCKMGFRAPNLLGTARKIAEGELDLEHLRSIGADEARAELLKLPGVGPKIANCVLLFAYGFQEAFPVDVWIMKALKELYFPKRRHVRPATLQQFANSHFGPNAGYAQQYLFHYMRTKRERRPSSDRR